VGEPIAGTDESLTRACGRLSEYRQFRVAKRYLHKNWVRRRLDHQVLRSCLDRVARLQGGSFESLWLGDHGTGLRTARRSMTVASSGVDG